MNAITDLSTGDTLSDAESSLASLSLSSSHRMYNTHYYIQQSLLHSHTHSEVQQHHNSITLPYSIKISHSKYSD